MTSERHEFPKLAFLPTAFVALMIILIDIGGHSILGANQQRNDQGKPTEPHHAATKQAHPGAVKIDREPNGQQKTSNRSNKEKKNKGNWNKVFEFIARNDDVLVAISTVTIAAFTIALFLYGVLRYEDAFGVNQSTAYVLYCGGNAGLHPDGNLATYKIGNEYT